MNKLKVFYNKLHLNLIKELTIIITSNLLALALSISLFIIFKSINYIILLVVLLVFINLVLIYRYILINNKNYLNNLSEISDILMYFYLDINNKVKPIEAIENMKSHCSINMNDNLVLLLDEMKKDKTFSPFIKFANKYSSINIESLMLAIYQLTINYSNENILNFNNLYKEHKTKVEGIYSSSYKKKFSFITLTPVIGTMVITVIVIIATILLVRGYING